MLRRDENTKVKKLLISSKSHKSGRFRASPNISTENCYKVLSDLNNKKILTLSNQQWVALTVRRKELAADS